MTVVTCLSVKQMHPAPRWVTFTINEHRPYCGGAAPSKEMEKGFITILPDQDFIIKKGVVNDDKVPVIVEVTADSIGRFSIALDTGRYLLIFPEKHATFEDFYQTQSKERPMLQPGPRDCFLAWWQRPDATFYISDTTSHVECTIRSTCDAGFNPCMYYTGPKRP
ncbi:MAG: hypothetical protein IPL46_16395 [Saprospiraceae bacterium]|nr:hypothetical protein [Saprospiraceae bacterium]